MPRDGEPGASAGSMGSLSGAHQMREVCRFAWIRIDAATTLSLDVCEDAYRTGGRTSKTGTGEICNYNDGRVMPQMGRASHETAGASGLWRRCRRGRRRVHLILVRRLGPEQVANEVIPAASDHVRFVAESVAAIGQHDQIEVLVSLDQFIDHEQRAVRGHVAVHRSVRE